MRARLLYLVVCAFLVSAPASSRDDSRLDAARGVLARASRASYGLSASSPNVLLVVMDDVGVDQIEAYGENPHQQLAPTPTITALSEFGIRYRKAYCSQTCSPTRVEIHTGEYASRFGVGQPIDFDKTKDLLPDPSTYTYLPGAIPSHYECAAIGKWHIANQSSGAADHPLLVGYDTWRGTPENIGSYYFWPYYVDGVLQENYSGTYATVKQFDDALHFVQRRGSDPWFCYVALNAPHKPVQEPPLDLHSYGPISGASDYTKYRANIEAIDTKLFELLTRMNPSVLASTIVVVMGDNGTHNDFVPTEFSPGKGSLYEGGIRVPLIVWSANTPAGVLVDDLFQAADLPPTIVEACGGAWPAGRDGVSHFSRWVGAPSSPPRGFVYEHKNKPNREQPSDDFNQFSRAATDGRYKIIEPNAVGEPDVFEFYDLNVDPQESFDLEGSSLTAGEQAARDALIAFMASVDPSP